MLKMGIYSHEVGDW